MSEPTTLSTRPPLPVLQVPKGLNRVAVAPSVLRATVGGEFLIAIWFPGTAVGGMTHLSKSPFAGYASSAEAFDLIDTALEAFLSELRAVRPRFGKALAAVAGGADLIGLLPEQAQSTVVKQHADHIRIWLVSHGIEVQQLEAGGRRGRIVALYPAQGRIHVELLPKVGSASPADEQPVSGVRQAHEEVLAHEKIVGLSEIHVDTSPHRLTAVLGSCVGIALYDPTTRIGGLSHTMMPKSRGEGGPPGRYVDTAIPELINGIVAMGGNRRQLQARLVGGARIMAGREEESCFQIAGQNITASQQLLGELGIPILERKVGGFTGFRATIDLRWFRLHVRLLGSQAVRS